MRNARDATRCFSLLQPYPTVWVSWALIMLVSRRFNHRSAGWRQQSKRNTSSSSSAIDHRKSSWWTRWDGVEQYQPTEKAKKRRYRWQMSHYFYIHMSLFILNGLLGGLIVYLIENHSSVRNEEMDVPYLDAWFVSCSCVYNCGLTTIDFGKLSHASQIVLMILTFISGITISTLPALVIKAQTHKKVTGLKVDDDHDKPDEEEDEEDALPTFNIPRRRNLPPEIRKKLATLPTAAQLRYRAYITCILLILGTCFAIYLIAFCAIGGWLSTQYQAKDLVQGNRTVNPWYISFIVTVTGFNQNGLTPFSTGFTRFVNDVYLNICVMLVKKLFFSSRMYDSFQLVMFGTSLFLSFFVMWWTSFVGRFLGDTRWSSTTFWSITIVCPLYCFLLSKRVSISWSLLFSTRWVWVFRWFSICIERNSRSILLAHVSWSFSFTPSILDLLDLIRWT